MSGWKHDERTYPAPGSDNERSTRKLLAAFERLAGEGQDDIVAACWASTRAGRNPLDAIAEALVMLSHDRLAVRRLAVEVSEATAVPLIVITKPGATTDPHELYAEKLQAALVVAVHRECLATPPAESCWTRRSTRAGGFEACEAARRALSPGLLAALAAREAEAQERRRAAEAAAAAKSRKPR